MTTQVGNTTGFQPSHLLVENFLFNQFPTEGYKKRAFIIILTFMSAALIFLKTYFYQTQAHLD